MSYDLFVHRHNFSVWAAARAAQRGFTNVENLRDALENCGIMEFLKKGEIDLIDEARFETLHRDWCHSVINFLMQRGISNVTFGRAAKLLAVYLKAMVVLGSGSQSRLATFIHPPIDRILLRNLSRAGEVECPQKRFLRDINWTELKEDRYYELISKLKKCLKHGEPFWMIEQYWTVTND